MRAVPALRVRRRVSSPHGSAGTADRIRARELLLNLARVGTAWWPLRPDTALGGALAARQPIRLAVYPLAALSVDWNRLGRRVAWGGVGVMTLMSVATIVSAIAQHNPADWRVLAAAAERAGTPALYVQWDTGAFRYSPLYAWMLMPLGWLGPVGWTGMHVLAAFAFGSWRITAVVLISWPFWFDATSGNVLIFVVLAAWWALHGSRLATLSYFALTLLMPRPLMLPVAAWLLWQRPDTRLPFGALFLLHAGLVVWTGLADEWLGALASGGDMLDHKWNVGPSQFIGAAWLPAGLALATWLSWRGRVGLASLAISPYMLPYYYLFGLLEIRDPARAHRRSDSDGPVGRPQRANVPPPDPDLLSRRHLL